MNYTHDPINLVTPVPANTDREGQQSLPGGEGDGLLPHNTYTSHSYEGMCRSVGCCEQQNQCLCDFNVFHEKRNVGINFKVSKN